MPSKTETQKPVETMTFREQLAELIADAREGGVPLAEIQSALDSEGDIVDKQFQALVDAAEKKKKGKK